MKLYLNKCNVIKFQKKTTKKQKKIKRKRKKRGKIKI